MEQKQIVLGQATYEISRVYTGQRPLPELMAEHLVRRGIENHPFDEGRTEAV